MNWFSTIYAAALIALCARSLNAAESGTNRFGFKGKEIFRKPRVAALRTNLLNHIYHHRGQLSVYLRLLDVPVPVVYGPTADENPFA